MNSSHRNHYDMIIAGAGASGLSLLWYITESDLLKNRSILLLDRSLTPADDKTWCFWDSNDLPMKDWIHHSWDSLNVRAYNHEFPAKLQKFGYHCMRSVDYSDALLKRAKADPRITLLEADITGFDTIVAEPPSTDRTSNGTPGSSKLGVVHTSQGDFTADWIFQSALKPVTPSDPSPRRHQNGIYLKQHFLGVEIKTEKACFDPSQATLMDFDTPQDRGLTFFYVLPFTPHEALIEYTFFTKTVLSRDEYMRGVEDYLSERFDLEASGYEITREEIGVIPMETRRYPARYNDRVVNMGTMGGLTKPSTGYTFTRIHRHCASIVSRLEQGRQPVVEGESQYRFRVYDTMLLYILEHQPAMGKQIFHDLFQRNRYDRVLTFLEEKTHPLQELAIFATLPYAPFLRSIWKMRRHILTGA